jgi:hypothetical protein
VSGSLSKERSAHRYYHYHYHYHYHYYYNGVWLPCPNFDALVIESQGRANKSLKVRLARKCEGQLARIRRITEKSGTQVPGTRKRTTRESLWADGTRNVEGAAQMHLSPLAPQPLARHKSKAAAQLSRDSRQSIGPRDYAQLESKARSGIPYIPCPSHSPEPAAITEKS